MFSPTCPGVQMSITQFAQMNRDGSPTRGISPSGRKSPLVLQPHLSPFKKHSATVLAEYSFSWIVVS